MFTSAQCGAHPGRRRRSPSANSYPDRPCACRRPFGSRASTGAWNRFEGARADRGDHGAHVIATASASNHDHLRDLGADETIDYHQQRFEDSVGDVDVVIDLVGGDVTNRSLVILRDGGTLTSIVAVPPDVLAQRREMAAHRDIRTTVTSLLERRDLDVLRQITELIDTCRLRVVVSASVGLSDVAKALTESMTGHARGKTVVTISEEAEG